MTWRQWRCPHQWLERVRTYAPPATRGPYQSLPFMPSQEELLMTLGCTTVILTCACGLIKTFRCIGKASSADVLERMIQ
jgi:Ni/Fe-hydrogenase subunit HybB-like protein